MVLRNKILEDGEFRLGESHLAEDIWYSLSRLGVQFFSLVANMVGKYVCADESTVKAEYMDLERIIVRTKCAASLNDSFSVKIDGKVFRIKIAEDSHGPLCLVLKQDNKKTDQATEYYFDSKEG